MTSLPGWKGSQREGAGRCSQRGNAADMVESEHGKWRFTGILYRTFDNHMFTLKYVQIDTFETSIYIRLYYIDIYIVCPYKCTSFVDFVADFSLPWIWLSFFWDSHHRNLPRWIPLDNGWSWRANTIYLSRRRSSDGCLVFVLFFRCVFLGDGLKTAQKPTLSSFFVCLLLFF